MANDHDKRKGTQENTPGEPAREAAVPDEENISYEDRSFQDFEPETARRSSISKKTKAVITILLLCMVAVIVAAGWQNLSPDRLAGSVEKNFLDNGKGGGFPSALVGTKVNNGNIKRWDKNLAYVSDTSFIVLSSSGGKLIDRQISYSDPVIVTKGSYCLIYNLGGLGFEINTMGDTIHKGDVKSNLLSGDINTRGEYAVLSETDGYLGKLTAFNTDNTQKFAYYFSDYYPSSVSINEEGTMAAVSGVSSKDGVLRSVLYVLDFTSAEPKAVLEFDDNLIYTVSFMDNGSIAVIGDSSASIVKSNYSDKQTASYNKLMLTAYDIDMYNGIALSLSRSGDGRSCNLLYMDKNGNAGEPVTTDLKITSISMYGDRIGVLSGEELRTFYKNGNEGAKTNAGVDAKAICMESENSAYILGISEMRFTRF